MPDSYFIDTNILIYRYSKQDAEKRATAARLIASQQGVVTVQVLNEFCNVVRRKFPEQFRVISSVLDELCAVLTVEPLTIDDTRTALWICQQHRFQFFDALILASALRLGCQAVVSEDMQHGFVLDNRLAVVNPFIK